MSMSRRIIVRQLWLCAMVVPGIGGCADQGGGSSDGGTDVNTTRDAAGGAVVDGAAGGGVVDGVPTGDGVAHNAWLQKKEYRAWPHESAPHASTGPHGSRVQTYVNAKLDASLAAKSSEHPMGSTAVKEFLDSGGNVTGWASMVKTQPMSDAGRGWYWYEVFDAKAGANAAVSAQGSATCTGCHSSGSDYVRIPHPLK